jgi:hypothetical protein
MDIVPKPMLFDNLSTTPSPHVKGYLAAPQLPFGYIAMMQYTTWSDDVMTATISSSQSFTDYMEYHRESLLLAEERHTFGREKIVWAIEKHEKDTDMIIRGRDIRKRELEQRLRMYDSGVKFSPKKILETVIKSHIRGSTNSSLQ